MKGRETNHTHRDNYEEMIEKYNKEMDEHREKVSDLIVDLLIEARQKFNRYNASNGIELDFYELVKEIV